MVSSMVVKMSDGYIVRGTDEYNNNWYIAKNYRGKYIYMLDYAFAKRFRDKRTAEKHAKRIVEG